MPFKWNWGAVWMLALLATGFAAGRFWPADVRRMASSPTRPLKDEVRRLEREFADLQSRRDLDRACTPAFLAGSRGPKSGGESREAADSSSRLASRWTVPSDVTYTAVGETYRMSYHDKEHHRLEVVLEDLLVAPTIAPPDEDEERRTDQARSRVQSLASTVRLFKKEQDRLPHALLELTLAFEGRPDGYVTDVPLDPWANPYLYDPGPGGQNFRVLSPGPDGREGTKDDLTAK